MKKEMRFFLAALALSLSTEAAAIQQTRTFEVGKGVVQAVSDPITGRIFTANAGAGRYADGASIGVLEHDGQVRSIALSSAPAYIAIAPTFRRVVVTIGGFGETGVDIVNADSLERTHVTVGSSPSRAVVSELTGRAYVIGRNNLGNTAPWLNPGSLSGTLTEIDLRTNESRIFQVTGFEPRDLIVDASGEHVYLIGPNYFRTGESMPGFVNVFDTAARSFGATPVSLGRLPQAIMASPAGTQLYVLGHVDVTRVEYEVGDVRRNGIRPAVHVLDAASLALQQTIALPDTRNRDLLGETILGAFAYDPAGRLFALDGMKKRLFMADLVSGAQRSVDLEDLALSMGFSPASRNVVVSFPRLGYAGIFSRDLERLDTVPAGTPVAAGDSLGGFNAVSFNPAGGETYVASNTTLTVLPAASSIADKVVNFTDLWWNPSEAGWGLFLDQQGTTLFAAIFTHDDSGAPTWMVMSAGARQPDGAFTGKLYRTSGPLGQSLANVREVGVMRFQPLGADAASVSYTIDGVVHASGVQREQFGSAGRTCHWSVGPSDRGLDTANFTSLWWNPQEPGWGLAVAQQGSTAFGVVFTYDAQNRPTWAAMSNGEKAGGTVFAGALYRAKLAQPVQNVGTMALGFESSNAGMVTYNLDDVAKSSPLSRQVFTRLATDCSND